MGRGRCQPGPHRVVGLPAATHGDRDQRVPITALSPSRCCHSLGLSGSRIPNPGWIPQDPTLSVGTFLLQRYFQEAKGTAIPIPILRNPGQAQPSCGRTDGCRPSSPMPA